MLSSFNLLTINTSPPIYLSALLVYYLCLLSINRYVSFLVICLLSNLFSLSYLFIHLFVSLSLSLTLVQYLSQQLLLPNKGDETLKSFSLSHPLYWHSLSRRSNECATRNNWNFLKSHSTLHVLNILKKQGIHIDLIKGLLNKVQSEGKQYHHHHRQQSCCLLITWS